VTRAHRPGMDQKVRLLDRAVEVRVPQGESGLDHYVLLWVESGRLEVQSKYQAQLTPHFPGLANSDQSFPFIRSDARHSCRSPFQAGYGWCRRFQPQLYR